jgi:hypothetical protein
VRTRIVPSVNSVDIIQTGKPQRRRLSKRY